MSQPNNLTTPPAGDLALLRDSNRYSAPQNDGDVEERGLFVLLAAWGSLVWARRWVVLAVVAVFVAMAGVYSALQTPTFLAKVSIQIDRDSQSVIDVEGFNNVRGNDAEFYQTQYELLRSRALAYRVVSDLNLATDESIALLRKPRSAVDVVRDFVGGLTSGGAAPATDDANASAQAKTAVNLLLERIAIAPVRNSRIVTLSFENEHPEVAQRVANGFAEAFVRLNLDRRYQAASYARSFLEEKLAQIKTKLEESETALVAYAQQQKLLDTEPGQPIASANLQTLNEKLITARSERLAAEAAWNDSREYGGLSLPLAQESRTIQSLREEQAKLQAEYDQKLGTLKPAYPEMIELRRKIDQTGAQIAAEVNSVRESLKLRFEVAKSVETKLEAELQAESARIFDQRTRNIQYTILQREVDTNRALYDGLLQRYKEIGAAGGVELNNVAVIDQAELPASRYTPNHTVNLLIGLILGLTVAIAGILAREQLDESVKSIEMLEKQIGFVPLGLVPLFDRGQSNANLSKTISDGRTALAEAMRSIRTALQFSTQAGLPKVLLLTSARPGEGKSTLTWALAVNLSMLNLRVLLIDCDLRKPSQHLMRGMANSAGTSNLLVGNARLQDVIHPAGDGSIDLITAGPMPPNPAELLVGPRLRTVLDEASSLYDIVILDGPPVLNLADAPILARQAEATLLVVKAGDTPARAVADAKRRLERVNANLIGAVLNQFDLRNAAKTYGYGYGYGYGPGSDGGFSYGASEQLPKA
jgi:capsular exopolysaccharide synthesis family protein